MSSTVIRKLKAHFARQGIPDVVISDNGPQSSSREFKKFSQNWEFTHITSSPGYPQSNGKAESAVKTAKRLMKKARMSGQDPYLSILHRSTPTQGLNASPAQRLLSRWTRTLLPIKECLLRPKVMDTKEGLIHNQRRQAKYYNCTTKDMDTLKAGDCVRIQPLEPNTTWKRARVVVDPTKWSWTPAVSGDGIAAISGEPWTLRELLQHQQGLWIQERHRCLHRTLVKITVSLQGLDV